MFMATSYVDRCYMLSSLADIMPGVVEGIPTVATKEEF